MPKLRQAEEALKRERDLLSAVMAATDVMLVYLDRDFNFLWVNPAYAETCRMKPEEMVGKNHFALYPNEENEAIFRRVRDTGEAVFYKDKAFAFPDQPERGTTYWNWSLTPVRAGGAETTGLVFSLRETTRHVEAKEALRASDEGLMREVQAERDKLSALVSSMQDEVWLADMEKKFTLMNPVAATEFSLSAGEVVDIEKLAASLEVLRPDGSPRPIEEAPPLRALSGEVVTNEEEIVRTPARGDRYRQVSASPLRDGTGRVIGSVSVVRDITDRKLAENALIESEANLRKLNEALEMRVRERTAELEKANRELAEEIEHRLLAERGLQASQKRLSEEKEKLEQKNIALQEVLGHVEAEKSKIQDGVAAHIEAWVLPALDRLAEDKDNPSLMAMLRRSLEDLSAPPGRESSAGTVKLTAKEREVYRLVRGGMSSKEISRILKCSFQTVEKHRKNIRKKLGIVGEGVYLGSI